MKTPLVQYNHFVVEQGSNPVTVIATCENPESAALIVHHVNSFPALVDALREIAPHPSGATIDMTPEFMVGIYQSIAEKALLSIGEG